MTRLMNLELKRVEIPFKQSFKHTSAERSVTETIIAIAHAEGGEKGYGEGCPRSYVTGESIVSCEAFFGKHRADILKIRDVAELRNWVNRNEKEIDQNPAAWCAIETAVLDVMARNQKQSLDQLLSLQPLAGDFEYTAVLGILDEKAFQAQIAKYLHVGFRHFKIKVSGRLETDRANIQSLQGKAATIRLDANNLWQKPEDAATYIKSLALPVWAMEEPLQARDIQGMQKLTEETGCKMILDESCLRKSDIDALPGDSNHWIPNIRLSKMGGILRSIQIAETCAQKGMKFIIGAQVGETSILTRLALSLANAYRQSLLAQEGAFGEHLLEKDIANPCIMFGKGGSVSADKLGTAHGLGLEVQA